MYVYIYIYIYFISVCPCVCVCVCVCVCLSVCVTQTGFQDTRSWNGAFTKSMFTHCFMAMQALPYWWFSIHINHNLLTANFPCFMVNDGDVEKHLQFWHVQLWWHPNISKKSCVFATNELGGNHGCATAAPAPWNAGEHMQCIEDGLANPRWTNGEWSRIIRYTHFHVGIHRKATGKWWLSYLARNDCDLMEISWESIDW